MKSFWRQVGLSSNMTGVLTKRRNLESPLPATDPRPANTLILDFYPLELRNSKFLLFRALCLYYLVTAVLVNKHSRLLSGSVLICKMVIRMALVNQREINKRQFVKLFSIMPGPEVHCNVNSSKHSFSIE